MCMMGKTESAHTASNDSARLDMHDLLQRLERQREQMHWLADKHRDLSHPEVVRASQMLDKLIVEIQIKGK